MEADTRTKHCPSCGSTSVTVSAERPEMCVVSCADCGRLLGTDCVDPPSQWEDPEWTSSAEH